MTLPFHPKRKKRVEAVQPPPPTIEKEPIFGVNKYGQYTTHTLQCTLVNLQVTGTLHGWTSRMREIEGGIKAELTKRGEPV